MTTTVHEPSPPDVSLEHADVASSSPSTDPQDLRKALTDADELKQDGNNHFRAKRWDEALAAYRSALGYLPKRPQPLHADSEERNEDDGIPDDDATTARSEKGTNASVAAREEPVQQTSPTELDIQCAKARAILNANIGACYAKLGEYKEVVAACTEALKDDPEYIKALQRRATANEQIASWSSLSGAQEDYKKLLELLPSTSPEVVNIRQSLTALTPRVEAAQKHETTEMLDKLKGLGNSILGNFGLSTDNFQFVPNGQGGYSMNFVQ